jgi:cell division septum initiation protein DivIVA
LESEYYALEVDERGFNTDLEAVNYSNQALMDRNLDLKSEYEALQKHSSLLTTQNKDLQKELDSFVETDDIVRRNLDRKDKVNQIRNTVNSAINQSNSMVERARTPTKSQFSEKQFQSDRVSTFNGNAGAQRTSYSGANA